MALMCFYPGPVDATTDVDVVVIGARRALSCLHQTLGFFVTALAHEELRPPRLHADGYRCLTGFHEQPVAGSKLRFRKLRHAEVNISVEGIKAARNHERVTRAEIIDDGLSCGDRVARGPHSPQHDLELGALVVPDRFHAPVRYFMCPSQRLFDLGKSFRSRSGTDHHRVQRYLSRPRLVVSASSLPSRVARRPPGSH